MSSCTDPQSKDRIGELRHEVVVEDITFIMCIVVFAPSYQCFALGDYHFRLSFRRSFASLISFSVMGKSVYQRVLVSLT